MDNIILYLLRLFSMCSSYPPFSTGGLILSDPQFGRWRFDSLSVYNEGEFKLELS